MAVVQRIDPATYEHLALREEYRFVELRDGVLVEKPAMTLRHALTIEELGDGLRLPARSPAPPRLRRDREAADRG